MPLGSCINIIVSTISYSQVPVPDGVVEGEKLNMEIITTPLPKEELELFRELKDLKVIFDVGARIDTDYIELWPNSQHHLFEPNPEFFASLSDKVKDNPSVFANSFGLGDRNDGIGYQVNLQSFVDSVNINNPDAQSDCILSVKTLDEYVRKHKIKRIDFLKIDTEGYELRVLRGGAQHLPIVKFIQYEHWGQANDNIIRAFLYDLHGDLFDIESVGYRNVLCMNKNLVSARERKRLSTLIKERGYSVLQ